MSGIVVGVDGSPGSRAALRWAVAEAQLRRTTLTAVTVWQYPVVTALPTFGIAPGALPPYDELRAEAGRALDAVLDDEGVRDSGEHPVHTVVVEGPAASALIEASRDADLLVVGSRGHGGFKGMLLGSVSQHCVTHAECPVVVVRP